MIIGPILPQQYKNSLLAKVLGLTPDLGLTLLFHGEKITIFVSYTITLDMNLFFNIRLNDVTWPAQFNSVYQVEYILN